MKNDFKSVLLKSETWKKLVLTKVRDDFSSADELINRMMKDYEKNRKK